MAITTRENLRAKWAFTGIDLDAFIVKIEHLLTLYQHRNNQVGIISALDTFIDNNKENIELIMESPKYNGNLQIVDEVDFSRDIDQDGVYEILKNFIGNIHARSKMIKSTDPNGLGFVDRIKREVMELPKTMSVSVLGTDNCKPLASVADFDWNGNYIPSVNAYTEYCNIIDVFKFYTETLLDEKTAKDINEINPKMKVVAGQKCGKAFMKAARMYGLDDDEEFKKYYPAYGDAITKVVKKNIYVISLNPIDFLTMSFGNTWASCMTIDKQNIRKKSNNYSGMYCGGTLSYMLDHVSFVTYVIGTNGSKQHPEGYDKIFRNMMHYQDGILVQGRVYPQARDGATNLYDKMRNLFQTAINECLGNESNTSGWIKKKSNAPSYNNEYYKSEGVHYPDYIHFRDCTVSKLKDVPDKKITIGHKGICLYCGQQITSSVEISHSSCRV